MAGDTTVKKPRPAPKTFTPNWEEIMKVLGNPKQEAIYVNRSLDPEQMDGAWDFQAMQKGLGMRRVAADIGQSNSEIQTPTGFVFICGNCGYARRVIDSEHSFTCERPNASGGKGCGVIWEKEIYVSDEVNPRDGTFITKPVLEERKAIGKMARTYLMPKITGRYVADMQRETAMARKAAGQQSAGEMQPQTFGKKKAEKPAAPAEDDTYVIPDAPASTVGGEE